ncbi:hypothetical protein [Nannocystis pusilla]|uniref:hypothetical protein n=1 Tax=Nannocystis pusilla TaxID=889268 RepID=UPI003B7B8E1E
MRGQSADPCSPRPVQRSMQSCSSVEGRVCSGSFIGPVVGPVVGAVVGPVVAAVVVPSVVVPAVAVSVVPGSLGPQASKAAVARTGRVWR